MSPDCRVPFGRSAHSVNQREKYVRIVRIERHRSFAFHEKGAKFVAEKMGISEGMVYCLARRVQVDRAQRRQS